MIAQYRPGLRVRHPDRPDWGITYWDVSVVPLLGADGEIEDIIFREVNQAYERQGGLTNVVGKSIKEVLPNLEQHWKDAFTRVAKTGEPLWVSRWDVVPIPEHLRKNLPKKAQMEVPADTAQSMVDFRAEEVVGKIAPRPLLLLHTADDQVTPTEQSLRMFEKAGMPTELYLITGESHFPLAGDGQRFGAVANDFGEPGAAGDDSERAEGDAPDHALHGTLRHTAGVGWAASERPR